eukprot:2162684-Amphidinium_carterae.1
MQLDARHHVGAMGTISPTSASSRAAQHAIMGAAMPHTQPSAALTQFNATLADTSASTALNAETTSAAAPQPS